MCTDERQTPDTRMHWNTACATAVSLLLSSEGDLAKSNAVLCRASFEQGGGGGGEGVLDPKLGVPKMA